MVDEKVQNEFVYLQQKAYLFAWNKRCKNAIRYVIFESLLRNVQELKISLNETEKTKINQKAVLQEVLNRVNQQVHWLVKSTHRRACLLTVNHSAVCSIHSFCISLLNDSRRNAVKAPSEYCIDAVRIGLKRRETTHFQCEARLLMYGVHYRPLSGIRQQTGLQLCTPDRVLDALLRFRFWVAVSFFVRWAWS